MTDNDIVRRGYLNVIRNPQSGVIGRVLSVTSRRQWVVLRRESGGRASRVELYRNEDQSAEPNKIISLSPSTLRNVQILDRKKAFVLNLQEESCMFQCSSRADMEDWHRDIGHYSSSTSRNVTSPSSLSSHITDNAGIIYEDIPDDETYRVRLRKAKSLAFSGPCLLEILRDFERNLFHIAMFTEEELPRLVVKWQIDHIRQYGSNNMAFKFESGSKSSTGVDWFIVDTEPGCAIKVHRAVDYWAKHIVEQVKNIPGNARRSTLPGSPTTPDNSCGSTSLPRGSLGSSAPDPQNPYMVIDKSSRAPSSVYAAPEPAKGQKQGGGRINKSAAPPPPNSASNSTYMPLNVNSMDSSQNRTYEGISARPERPGNPPVSNGDSHATYMGIDPRTRDTPDKAQYMGLKDARSN